MSKKEATSSKPKKYQILIDWSSDYPILLERALREMFEGTGVELNYDSLKFYRNQPFQYIVYGKASEDSRKRASSQIRGLKFIEIA